MTAIPVRSLTVLEGKSMISEYSEYAPYISFQERETTMIKMMVTVVIVFTMCWLPFNILSLLLNDEEVRMWGALPYAWFAVHWLAMSHSCYNPIIYCYMNARFRGGFLQIIYRVPGLRRCCCLRRYLHTRGDRSYETTDEAFHLQRVNTCTTFISTRRKLRTNSMQASQSSCAETTVLR
ncbi:RYamide receptor-like [Haematobia irritans]|uniref:RYamide receptor-like n=1 Tax=Haematobia irritans TaxID=7368 RepID=UPI003F4FE8D2